MYSDIEIKELIEKSLSELTFPDSPAELYEPMVYCISMQGKRIRSTLALMTSNIFTDSIEHTSIMPVLGIEVFHGFTLVHDDMMDNAELRRNQPTIHKRWNSNVAILLGDALCIEAYKLLCRAEASLIPQILDCFNRAATGVCEGQQYDMNFENRTIISESEYLRMIELKTAILISASMQIGAIIAGADAQDIDRASLAGLYLGMAFQIQDDLLDTYSETSTIGKSVGSDIENNKKTFLLTTALNLASGTERDRLIELITTDTLSANKFDQVKSIYDNLNIQSIADAKIKHYFDLAIDQIDQINSQSERKILIKGFLNKLISRKY